MMLRALQRVVHLEYSQSPGVEDESLYDSVRAYGLLLHATGLNKTKAKEILETKEVYNKVCAISSQ